MAGTGRVTIFPGAAAAVLPSAEDFPGGGAALADGALSDSVADQPYDPSRPWAVRHMTGAKAVVPDDPDALAALLDTPLEALPRIKHIHDSIIDVMLCNPAVTQTALARQFGFTVGWLSRIVQSDVFQDRLAARRKELIDPTIVATVEERLRGLAAQSADVLMDKLDATKDAALALKVLDTTAKALGYGARPSATVAVQTSFVVALPEKSATSADWALRHGAAS